MSVSLILVTADGKQRELPLNKPVQVMGRHTDCQIRIPSASISRHHCEFVVRDDRITLRDLGSSNGTHVNRKKLSGPHELAPGDLICIGELVFVVRINGRPAAIDSEDVLEDGLVELQTAPKAAAARSPVSGMGSSDARSKPKGKPASASANDDSSVADFDLLDEDDIDKKQPKL